MKPKNHVIGYRFFTVAIIIAILLSSAVTYAAGKTLIDPVVVKVNGEEISETVFLYFLMGKYGDDVAEQLIEHAVLAQEAGALGLTLDKESGWEYLRNKYTEEKLASLDAAFDLDQVAEALARELLAMQVVNKKVEKIIDEEGLAATDEEILAFYLDNIDNMTLPESARFSWIIISDEEKANEAHKRLEKGDDFATVAGEMSEDELTSGDGGDVGKIAKGTKGLPKVIEDAVFGLNEGDFSDVIKIKDNYFIVMTTKKFDAYEPSLEEMTDLIREKIESDRAEEPLGKWLMEISDKADIEVVYPIFQEMGEKGGMVPVEDTNRR